ncbi:MAG: hypothetical protein KDC49_00355 [Saprospiraceae bacterium]|nr:hypothetical protein [Saprospiraceae bacterium]
MAQILNILMPLFQKLSIYKLKFFDDNTLVINTLKICLFCTFFTLGCIKVDIESTIPFSEYTLFKKYFHNNNFPIDGVYILNRNIDENGPLYIYFFRDGTVFYAGGKQEGINCFPINNAGREVPYWWGYFNKEGEQLQFEMLDPRGPEKKYKLIRIEGKMISDSSLYVVDYLPTGNPDRRDTFIFHTCIGKPDSLNIINRNISKYQ